MLLSHYMLDSEPTQVKPKSRVRRTAVGIVPALIASLGVSTIVTPAATAAVNQTVTFDANSGAGTMANQRAKVATALTINNFTRTGYTFAGWNTAANGSGTPYADAASYPFTATATLFAQWTALSHVATYNSQGGSAVTPGSFVTGGSSTFPPKVLTSLDSFVAVEFSTQKKVW